MSTNAYIGMVTDEGTIRYIYSHWDGYLSGVGNTLLENYNTTAQVAALIEQGDLSSLEDTIESSEFYYRDRGLAYEEVAAQETEYLDDLDQEFNYVWTGVDWIVNQGMGYMWYKLAYFIEAEIRDPNGYVFWKELA